MLQQVLSRYMLDKKHAELESLEGSKPKLVVLGLDRCILDCGGPSFTQLCPPFERDANEVYDSNDNPVRVAEKTKIGLQWLFDQDIVLCILCSTARSDIARQLLRDLDLESYFQIVSITTDSPKNQIKDLKKSHGLEFDDILYIDHVSNRPQDMESMGIIAYETNDLLNPKNIHQAMDLYLENLP